MASVKYGSIVTELRGSINGVTFQRCGQSLSMRSNPSHRVTPTQSAIDSRNVFAFIVGYWRNLSAVQKSAWQGVSSSYPYYDKFGNSIVLTGYQLFMALNRTLMLFSGAPNVTPSVYNPFPIISASFGNLSISGASLIYNRPSAPVAEHSNLVFMSQPYPSNCSSVNRKLTYVWHISDTVPNGENLYSVIRPFLPSTLVAGTSFSVELWLTDDWTGLSFKDNSFKVNIVA